MIIKDEPVSDEERYLQEMLMLLQEQHARAAKPYLDKLAQINAVKTCRTFYVEPNERLVLGDNPFKINSCSR